MAWTNTGNIKGPKGDPFRILGSVPAVSDLPTSSGGTPAATTTASKNFTASTASIANPERGWFQYSETHWTDAAGSSHTPLVQADLTAARTGSSTVNGATVSNRSVVFRYYVMEYMRNNDTIPAAFLTAVANDFATARAAGVKLLIRFTYSTDGTTGANTDGPGPYNSDTTVTRTLSHVSQLTSTVNAGADVVMAVQAGFIGTWGEWYYTDFWGNKGTLTAQNWTDRASLITAMLGWDSKISILLRYPGIKHRYMQGTGLPANAATRLGFHNDAFLADAEGNDWGTYNTFANGQTAAQLKTYLTTETARPVFMLGETAGVSTRSTYTNAASEMDTYNWSVLNPNFHPDVLASWSQANKDEVGQKLGYRLRLASATLPTAGSTNGTANVTLSIVNDGWAAPVLPRPIQLVFVNGGTTVTRTLAKDIRTLAQGTNTWSENVTLPGTTGTWAIHLSMPDPVMSTRTEYAIRLANTTTYSGVLNDLAASVSLTASSGGTAPAVGDAYTVTSDGHLYTWNGTSWVDGGPIVGPKGDKGDTGAAGATGSPGPANNLTIGTVETVANGPNSPNAIFAVRYISGAWEFASLAAAVTAGLNTAQTIWFIGGPSIPAWARAGDMFTQA